LIYIAGPGHGGPGLVANTYLEGTYNEYYPDISEDEEGMQKLFKQFSFPGGVPSHVAPETPGSIHEGGELGYAVSHAYGAAFDNPDLIVACVVGDGEAETGPLAAAWHSNKFLNPVSDGAVLPFLHLNGYKIANPIGYGYKPYFVEGSDPETMHQLMTATLDTVIAEIKAIQHDARSNGVTTRPRWPMIILRTPKGWTGPKEVDGKKTEDFWRSHQVPFAAMAAKPDHVKLLEEWMKSYRPKELFDENGKLIPELAELAPKGHRRMGEATRVMGLFLRDVMKLNMESRNFRVMGPDETASNRLGALFEVTDRTWMDGTIPEDDHLSPNGRVMEILSEHTCQGWLEGYLLTSSPVATGSSPATRRLSISSTPCSINTPSGSRSPGAKFRGGVPSPPSTTC
jgi:xylulose-5-phosphate/fructose-6-phosphate phosphoketolase